MRQRRIEGRRARAASAGCLLLLLLPARADEPILPAVTPPPPSTLAAKLAPSRFPGMSPFMAAVVGYVLGESYTDPEIAEMDVSRGRSGSAASRAWPTCGKTGTG